MTTEPDGIQGTPPEPRRPVAVRVPSPREAVPPLRTVAVAVSGMAAVLGALSIVGQFELPVEALTPVCLCIAGCVGGSTTKSIAEHLARAYAGRGGP